MNAPPSPGERAQERVGATVLVADAVVAVLFESLVWTLLALAPGDSAFATCPVGRAAHVHLPGVRFLDVMRARLRL